MSKKSLLNTALTAKSGRRVHPPPPTQAELFTHTTVNSKKLATSKFSFFFFFKSSLYVKWAEISTFRLGGGRGAGFSLGPVDSLPTAQQHIS